jgi:hypothetical protein
MRLCASRRPSTKPGSVIPVSVYSIKCHVPAWPLAHIGKELFKGLVKKLYATPPIVLVFRIFGIFAAALRCSITHISGRSRHAVFFPTLSSKFLLVAPAAFGSARSNRCPYNISYRPAIALKVPSRMPRFLARKPQGGKIVEFLARKVFESRVLGWGANTSSLFFKALIIKQKTPIRKATQQARRKLAIV